MVQVIMGYGVVLFSLCMAIVAIVCVMPSTIRESKGVSIMGFAMAGGMSILSGFIGYWLIIGRSLADIFVM